MTASKLRGMPYDRLLHHRCRLLEGSFLVTFCCARRQPWLREARTAALAVTALNAPNQLGLCRNHAYVVMPDHVHWLLSLAGSRPVSSLVAACKAISSRSLHRDGIADFAWQAGFHEHQLRSQEDLREKARYLVANPLRAGLATGLVGYRWWYSEWTHDPESGLVDPSLVDELLLE